MEDFQEKDILWPESYSIQNHQTIITSNYTNSSLNPSLMGTSFSSGSDSSDTTAELEESELSEFSWPHETGEEEAEEISCETADGEWQEADILFPYGSLKNHEYEYDQSEWRNYEHEDNFEDLERKKDERKVSLPIDIPKRKSNDKTGFMFYQSS